MSLKLGRMTTNFGMTTHLLDHTEKKRKLNMQSVKSRVHDILGLGVIAKIVSSSKKLERQQHWDARDNIGID